MVQDGVFRFGFENDVYALHSDHYDADEEIAKSHVQHVDDRDRVVLRLAIFQDVVDNEGVENDDQDPDTRYNDAVQHVHVRARVFDVRRVMHLGLVCVCWHFINWNVKKTVVRLSIQTTHLKLIDLLFPCYFFLSILYIMLLKKKKAILFVSFFIINRLRSFWENAASPFFKQR